ncbi:hypothetical protein SEVIR_2G283000v4 [Setaria viridis]|uniref:Transcription factor 25 n=1 Tax=Setaria viridis TaxID=4556 RepID=A0A4U6VW11_SETVI|nr:transcription factor 25 [Setaria viridis]TKW34108.1 hypothetical protein SEVIR_2G283000v2 [Setaria viridis]
MSARLLRRVLQEREAATQDPDVAEDEQPEEEEEASPPRAAARNLFDLLDGGDDEEEDKEDEAERSQPLSYTEQKHSVQKKPTNVVPETNKKSKKKKKKSKAEPSSMKSKDEQSLDSILEDLSIEKKPMQQRVHQSDRATGKEIETDEAGATSILTIDPKHLKGENEMRRIFGSKVVDSFESQRNMPSSSRQVRGVRRVAHNPRKTLLVSPPSYWPPWDKSISMDLLETKSGLNYFRYTFDPSVSHVQELFEAAKAANDLNAIAAILGKYPYHPESLLTFAELFKYSGEHQSSADAVEKCLFALECAWHPLFSPLQGNYQLKYSHDINKPFFTALFSHMKNLDRRGCHRSALEVCKFLLSLDSDDPKGALFCIDYFALRSQQYKWLEQFAEEYQCDNSLWLFPNFSFSLAIARFYLERDATSEGSDHADKSTSVDLMKQALMLHPLVLCKIVDKAPLKDSSWTQILRNVFFGSAKPGSPSLEHMINIYVERHYIMWRFPELQNLLKEAALLVIESLKQDNREAQDWACVIKEAFSSEKNEYSHLLVSDFSDTTPSLPPEELRPFMVGPGMVHEMPPVEQEAAGAERLRAPRDVVGRNPALVFLESLLPWVDYGDNHHDANDDNNGD